MRRERSATVLYQARGTAWWMTVTRAITDLAPPPDPDCKVNYTLLESWRLANTNTRPGKRKSWLLPCPPS